MAGAGLPVTVLERSRKPGGRMASRRMEGRRVDLGASYLTVSDDRFAAVVERWQAAGLARPWTDTFDVRDADGSWQSKSGPVRWGAPQGLRSLVEHEAEGLDVQVGTVAEVDLVDGAPRVDGRAAPAVVLAMPDPQARRLLAPALEDVAARPRRPLRPDPRADGGVGRAVLGPRRRLRQRQRRALLGRRRRPATRRRSAGAGGPLHARPRAQATSRTPRRARDGSSPSSARLLALPEPRHAEVHRWTFAKPSGSRERTFLLTDDGVGCCGDAWSRTAKVESAFLSGLELGEALVARFG